MSSPVTDRFCSVLRRKAGVLGSWWVAIREAIRTVDDEEKCDRHKGKRKRSVFAELHSKAAQPTVTRFHRNLSNLHKKNEKGYNVGRLKRQAPVDYRSVTYNQSGFDLDEKRVRDRFAYLRLNKIGWVKIRYRRPIPDRATVKEVTFKKETTGE
jgi:putative transposase